MASAKQLVRDVLESLPDDCSVEEIQYAIYIHQRIAEGEQGADEGRVVPHDEVMREAREWLGRL